MGAEMNKNGGNEPIINSFAECSNINSYAKGSLPIRGH